MKKQTKKKIIQYPIKPAPVVLKDQPRWVNYFPYGITILFFILSLIGILRHEMWRDEYQAWMVAVDAHSIGELMQNLKYEGNPVLWHSFLFIISSITDDPFWMQLFHILVSTSFIYLINRYSPFTILQKCLLTFGYFTFFEYNLISRGYGLGFLLIVVFCILYKQRHQYILWIGVVLFLLANSTIFGLMLAVSFGGILFLDRFFNLPNSKIAKSPVPVFLTALALIATGVITGYLQIRPEPDNSFPALYVNEFDITRLRWALSRVIHAYFPIPEVTSLHFWNRNLFVPDATKFLIVITPIILLAWIIAFLRKRLILLLYTGGTLLLLVFYYYSGFIWARYSGHLFLLLIACSWLADYYKEKPFRWGMLNKLSLVGNSMRNPMLITILALSLIGGVYAYTMDFIYPFSTSEKAAQYIRQNNLENIEILGSKDYVISPLATQLKKPILYAERKERGSFIIYDQKRTNIWSFQEVQSTITQMQKNGMKKLLLVKDVPLQMTFHDTGESIVWSDALLTDELNMRLLTTIEPGIVHDELYYIYLIEAVR